MNDSAISAIATVPIAKANGAAGPVAWTTSVILNAAVTVGDMTASERPMASGRLRRDRRGAMCLQLADLGTSNQYLTPSLRVPRTAPKECSAPQTGPLGQARHLFNELARGDLAAVTPVVAQRPVVSLRGQGRAGVDRHSHQVA